MYILLLNYACTLMMTGLIWFVQIVHYPLFAAVGRSDFTRYEAVHSRLTSGVVVPIMLVELASAFYLAVRPPSQSESFLFWGAFGLLCVVWLSTFLLQIPQHQALGSGFDASAHRALVLTNWVRTAAWSIRSVLLTIATLRTGGAST